MCFISSLVAQQILQIVSECSRTWKFICANYSFWRLNTKQGNNISTIEILSNKRFKQNSNYRQKVVNSFWSHVDRQCARLQCIEYFFRHVIGCVGIFKRQHKLVLAKHHNFVAHRSAMIRINRKLHSSRKFSVMLFFDIFFLKTKRQI